MIRPYTITSIAVFFPGAKCLLPSVETVGVEHSCPGNFSSLKVPLNVFERNFDDAFKALSMQAQADGFRLKKTGRKRPLRWLPRLTRKSRRLIYPG